MATAPTAPSAVRGWDIVAHRGASDRAPENTLSALRAAAAGGADLVEIDVQRTHDGALVLMHDTTLRRTTDVRRQFPTRSPWRVGDFTLAEIRRLDAGSWKSTTFAGEPVPTLGEAITLFEHSTTGILLEIKAPALYPRIEADVAAATGPFGAPPDTGSTRGRLVVQSFDYPTMFRYRCLAPHARVGLLGRPRVKLLSRLTEWADEINPHHLAADRGYIATLRDHALGCRVWTPNRPAEMKRALALGVDGVITDRPDLLHELAGSIDASSPTRL